MIKKTIIVLFCLVLLVLPVSALLNISVNSQTKNSISWDWSNNYSLTALSIDGYQVPLFDKNSSRFDLTGLNPNEKHSIKIYMGVDNITNTTTTLDGGLESNLDLYILFILGLVCLYFGFTEPIIGFAALVFGCIGILTSLNNSFTMGLLFVLLILSSIFVSFNKR